MDKNGPGGCPRLFAAGAFMFSAGSGNDPLYLKSGGNQHVYFITTFGTVAQFKNNGEADFAGPLTGVELASSPSAPATNGWKVYAKDSGGKTALYAKFATGAEVQLAIEP